MDLQPTLAGPNITLRPVERGDFAALHAAAADPELWAMHPARDRWQEAQFRAHFDTWLMRGGGLAIVEKESGRMIGASCYSTEAAGEGEVEIGWTFLARSHWGGPTNREVKRLMIGHALRFFDRVIFRVARTNLRSRGALEKIGAELTDRVMVIDVAGAPVEHVVYAIGPGAPLLREGT
ncbi:MAG: GNAT family N-acetyltransferase [Alphaproteobacteria bacterium]|nr:MAG: GNAT family N-acetyltransferase [Alphaproteobacteria bacterium]